MKKLTTTEFILTAEEAKLIKHCLDYCYHRATTEKKIANYFSVEKIDALRKELQ